MTRRETGDSAPPRLIVHLGVQKTGTTSLHHFLARNRARLAERLVVLTPEAGTPMRPLGRAAIAFSLDPTPATEARLFEAVQTIRADLPQDGRTVLISHENLAGAMPGNGGETRLFPLLPRIVSVLDLAFAPLRPLYALSSRDMPAWKPSVWAQAVRTDGYGRSFDQFLAETRDLPGRDDLLMRLEAAVPGRLVHLPLEDEPDPSRPGARLLRLSGLAEDELAALQPLEGFAMQRLNAGATEFLRLLNTLALNPHARAKVADLVAQVQYLFNADAGADHRPEGSL